MSTRVEMLKHRWTRAKCALCGHWRDYHGDGECADYDGYFPELGGGPQCTCRGFVGPHSLRAWWWNHLPVHLIEWWNNHRRLADTREGTDNESEGLYLGITPGPEHNTEDEDATKTTYIDEWSEQFGPDTREGTDE